MTPMMQQLQAAREKHPGMMIFFQNGEFYELFGDDAVVGHKILGITLTKREETPMAGFPLAKLEHYLRMLLSAGQRVAVVEQMEPAHAEGKKIIRREVTRIVTMGTITEDELLDPRQPNHLVALCQTRQRNFGLAWVDLTSGLFQAMDLAPEQLADELARLTIAECLIPDVNEAFLSPYFRNQSPKSISTRPAWTFEQRQALELLKQHFQVGTMSGFGFQDHQPCLAAAGALLHYLQETLKANLGHLTRLVPFDCREFLVIDEVTRRSLELTRTLRDNLREGSLLSMIDRSVTPMGARCLHDSLLSPLKSKPQIEARHDAVEELMMNHGLRQTLRSILEVTSDLYRLTTRISTARATPKDLGAVARTLRMLPKIKALLTSRKSALLNNLESQFELVPDLRELLDKSLNEDLPYSAKDGGMIRQGFHAELDELRTLSREGKDWIARYQAQEVTRTGITSLKVGFTDIMGYYIEVTNTHESRVPPDYIHERTLKNAKRYITPKLKEYEEKILTAQEKSQSLEFDLFLQIRDKLASETTRLFQTAGVLAQLDFLGGLAELASLRNYVRPTMTDEPVLHIQAGRHPVLDQSLPPGTFVPNDIQLSTEDGSFWLITGPNMAGKSTFIRQCALLTLMAHLGSFVPAKSATVGITDRIFTRVGASDELNRGQSTFMVEMTEAANILNNATPKSLVILDEIGRGTSTYDGLSLAWAMTEYLHDVLQCRTLFATHYHELAKLSDRLPRLRNYNVEVQELEKEIVFLHSIAPGNADKSYGIHVARLAGVPNPVLERAEAVLGSLEQPDTLHRVQSRKGMSRATPRAVTPPEKVVKTKPVSKSPSLFGLDEDEEN